MKREDRMEEYLEAIGHFQRSQGLLWGQARQRAAKNMGHVNAAKELELLRDHETEQLRAVERLRAEDEELALERRVQERDLEEELEAFDKIVESLAAGPTSEDMTWVRTHSAMSRKQRLGDDVVVTSEDIKDAPSRYAVNMLVNWVNEPKEFYKLVLQADKKRLQERSEEASESVEDDLSSIDELLGEFGSGD